MPPSAIKVAAAVRAELLLGAAKSNHPKRTRRLLDELLAPFETAAFGAAEAEHYAIIRADLEKRGRPVGPNDLLVAATVLAHGGTIVTHNTKEFRRVKGLQVDDWTKPARR